MTFATLVTTFITGVIKPLSVLAFAVALVLFLWGLVRYLGTIEKDEGRKSARSFMLWGIVIMAVMVSVWGLVNVAVSTFFPSGTDLSKPTLPTVQ